MKSLLLSLGSQVLREVLATQQGAGSSLLGSLLGTAPARARPVAHPDFAYLTRFAKRLFALAAIGFVFSLFFVFGSMMAIGAVAQSIDLFGVFVASTVFYTGAAVALLGLIGALVCVAKGRRHSFSWEFFYRHVDEPAVVGSGSSRAAYASDSAAKPTVKGPFPETATAPNAFASPGAVGQPAGGDATRRPGPERIAS